MLHNGKRVELKVALECSRSWLHSLETYRNREYGRPYEPEPPKPITFPRLIGDWMYHEQTCAARQFGEDKGPCDCGYEARS